MNDKKKGETAPAADRATYLRQRSGGGTDTSKLKVNPDIAAGKIFKGPCQIKLTMNVFGERAETTIDVPGSAPQRFRIRFAGRTYFVYSADEQSARETFGASDTFKLSPKASDGFASDRDTQEWKTILQEGQAYRGGTVSGA